MSVLLDTKPDLSRTNLKSSPPPELDSNNNESVKVEAAAGSDGCSCFLCNQCPQSFDTLDALEKHMNDAHDMDEMEEMIVEEDEEEEDRAPSASSDVLSEASSPMSTGGSPPSSGSKQRTPKQYVCRFCQKVFDTRSHLNIHYTHTHRDKPQYECDLCDMVFAVKRELSTHRRTHSGECTHICTQCGKEFGTRQLLKKHWMWHTGERSHVCPHCSKAFFQKGHLTQHLMIHAGGRPHVCGLCAKTFIFKFDLNRHMKIHQERGFACESCGRAFLKETDLRAHEPGCDGVRIESSASGDTFMLSPPASVTDNHTAGAKQDTSDTHSDISSITAPSSIISPPPSVTKMSPQKGKRKSKGSQSPMNLNTTTNGHPAAKRASLSSGGDNSKNSSQLSNHAALMNNINNVISKNTQPSNGGVTANASLFPTNNGLQGSASANNNNTNSGSGTAQSGFFCFMCMRPFPSQAAYTLHVTYEHFKGAVQQLNNNGGNNGKSPQQTNHGTKPAAILNGLRQSGIDVNQAFGQLPISSAQAMLIAQMAAAANNNNSNSNTQQQQNLLFNIMQQHQKKQKEQQTQQNGHNDHSFTSSPTGVADTSGSDEGSLNLNVQSQSCASCLTSERRTREVQSLLAAKETELVGLRTAIHRLQAMSAALMDNCSDFDKLWMMQNKPIQAILTSLNDI